jgi:hypothetical protein
MRKGRLVATLGNGLGEGSETLFFLRIHFRVCLQLLQLKSVLPNAFMRYIGI